MHALDIIPLIKKQGIIVLGLERNANSIPLARALEDLAKASAEARRVCFVVGNEVTGVSPEVLSSCDVVCHLPMKGKKESLNVAVAFGVAAYLIDARL